MFLFSFVVVRCMWCAAHGCAWLCVARCGTACGLRVGACCVSCVLCMMVVWIFVFAVVVWEKNEFVFIRW